ncbi:transposase [Salinibacter ruber]|uniref:transposase n=1 Tax=Salinibacter ruber TaxID=146919 RepID=UPI000E58D2B8
MPGNWQEVPSGATAEDPLPIQVVGLPTYAPWLNPIEKLWRYLKQEVVHLHQEENFAPLHDHVDAFLDQFADGSQHLLRCVGLLPN